MSLSPMVFTKGLGVTAIIGFGDREDTHFPGGGFLIDQSFKASEINAEMRSECL